MGAGRNGEIGSVALTDLTPGLFRTVHFLAVPSSGGVVAPMAALASVRPTQRFGEGREIRVGAPVCDG
jgi:hypothetical protein